MDGLWWKGDRLMMPNVSRVLIRLSCLGVGRAHGERLHPNHLRGGRISDHQCLSRAAGFDFCVVFLDPLPTHNSLRFSAMKLWQTASRTLSTCLAEPARSA